MDTTAPHVVRGAFGERGRRTRAAWERFVAGDDDVQGVPCLILLSWYRSRDRYLVDPLHTSPPPSIGAGGTSLLQDSVFTQLGGIAASLADHTDGSLTTVTDGSGRILGSWGADEIRRRAAESNLAPLFTWSEAAAGTNGMGTALGRTRPVSVRGPEHWCSCLHEWTCNGVSVKDPVTGQPVAVLNISFWRQDPSRAISSGLERAVAPLRSLLLERAVRDGADLVKAFLEAERKATADDAVVAVDAGGNVVAANHHARTLEDRLPAIPALEPGERWRSASPRLREIAAEAGLRATKEPSWIGTGQLEFLSIETTFEFRPVTSDNGFIGVLLVSTDSPQGEPVHVSAEVMKGARNRVVGICENRLIILTPNEIRYAEADRHAVWLVTDRGRVRAASRGLDNVERELAPFGFLRVHRGYLVNVQRIREVDQGFCKGTLTVSTQHHGREVIPVARRHVPRLRTVLSI